MSENVQDYAIAYSYTKLEETAKTFRRLGEAYENTSEPQCNTSGISKQLFLVADVLEECMTMYIHTEEPESNFAKDLTKKCFMCGVRIKNVQHLYKNNGRSSIVFQARTVGHGCVVTRKIIPVIAAVFGCGYYSDDSNRKIISEEYHQYVFIQEDRFKMLSGVARINKGKNNFNGDNFSVSRLECGKAIAAIADGMGSGRRAYIESRMVIELMENCIGAGFDEKASLDLINSAYIAGGGAGNPVTMDMSVIDCQSGYMHCIKLGAVSTFIKRGTWVEIIKSTTLPIGVLEQVDYDCTTKKLYDGDYVVMVSDGILDNIPCVDKEGKLAEIIHEIRLREPNAMAEEILKKSLACNKMRAVDDCTVLVLGLFDTYDK
jgi:stage II sporulation protein E